MKVICLTNFNKVMVKGELWKEKKGKKIEKKKAFIFIWLQKVEMKIQ